QPIGARVEVFGWPWKELSQAEPARSRAAEILVGFRLHGAIEGMRLQRDFDEPCFEFEARSAVSGFGWRHQQVLLSRVGQIQPEMHSVSQDVVAQLPGSSATACRFSTRTVVLRSESFLPFRSAALFSLFFILGLSRYPPATLRVPQANLP